MLASSSSCCRTSCWRKASSKAKTTWWWWEWEDNRVVKKKRLFCVFVLFWRETRLLLLDGGIMRTPVCFLLKEMRMTRTKGELCADISPPTPVVCMIIPTNCKSRIITTVQKRVTRRCQNTFLLVTRKRLDASTAVGIHNFLEGFLIVTHEKQFYFFR